MRNKKQNQIDNLTREKEKLQEQLRLVCEEIKQASENPTSKFSFLDKNKKLVKELEKQKQDLKCEIISINDRLNSFQSRNTLLFGNSSKRLKIIGGAVAAVAVLGVLAFSGEKAPDVAKNPTTTSAVSVIATTANAFAETTIETTTFENTTEATAFENTTTTTTRLQTTKAATTAPATTKAVTTAPQTTQQPAPATTKPASGSSSHGSGTTVTYTNDLTNCSYILNLNSHKIHYPGCRGLANANEKNLRGTNDSFETCRNAGFEPCGICHPH